MVKKLQTARDTYRHTDMTIYLNLNIIYCDYALIIDRLCGLVVRVLGYRSGGPGLERGPLSLVSTTEELLDRKVAAPV
jgi:hypothetical protein